MADEKDAAYSLKEIFQRMELDLIASMKRNFKRHQMEELKEGFQWVQWQLIKLRSLVKYRKANKDIIGEYSKPIEKAIDNELQQSFNNGLGNVENAVNTLKDMEINLPDKKDMPEISVPDKGTEPESLNNILESIKDNTPLPKAPEDDNFFGMNEKKLKALHDSVKNDLRKAQESILRQMDDVYRQTIFKTHVFLQSGTMSLNQAIDVATKDFLDKGINCIQYKNGNRVNIASYSEMALRTASQRATFMGEGAKRDEFGIHTVVVSAHANTCKLCLPWQGRVLIDDVYCHGSKADGDYPLLSEAMKAGLLHPNCRHTLATYFPGITKLPKVPDEKKALENYKAEQQQRYMERQIRKWKRAEVGSCDTQNEAFANSKVKEWQQRLKEHLKNNPQLRRDYTREKPAPGISNKDVKNNAELLKQREINAKIKRDGAVRAKEFNQYWQEASLKDTIDKFAPDHTVIEKPKKGKILFKSNTSGIQVVYDIKGNYFRIQDLSIKGKRSYLDVEGNNPTNKTKDGKQKGRTKEEYEPLTHFINKDGDN